MTGRAINGPYEGEYLNRVAYPLGGIGAGMICLEGTGALSHFSLRHQPQVFNEPLVFAAISIKTKPAATAHIALVLEGPVPTWKIYGRPGTALGGGQNSWGLPRFSQSTFTARFPFGTVDLADPAVPLTVKIEGWSPFIPGNADDSSLPVAALEYVFTNHSQETVEAVFSFHARHFMTTHTARSTDFGSPTSPGSSANSGSSAGSGGSTGSGGFILYQSGTKDKEGDKAEKRAFGVEFLSGPEQTAVDCAWFRGEWFDTLTILWKHVAEGAVIDQDPPASGRPSPGASLYLPFRLKAGESRRIPVLLSWYVPTSTLRTGPDDDDDAAAAEESCTCSGTGCCSSSQPSACSSSQPSACSSSRYYEPWYAGRFSGIGELAAYWRDNYHRLREETRRFSETFYDTTFPPEVMEAVAANLSILKSPTMLRQKDGRLWAWEGCNDDSGCCAGSCTHVWNYAQALPHLFPDLERTLRETEFGPSQEAGGHQMFRSLLPIRPGPHDFLPAADGQLGGIMKIYREWRISGDTAWLRRWWPKVKESLNYCIATWDPKHLGVLVEPHHNTYDIEFWGPDSMCSSFYLGALQAAIIMAEALEEAENEDIALYKELLAKGRRYMESELWNGEYFHQKTDWLDIISLSIESPRDYLPPARRANCSPETLELLEREGPKYQYGLGCLSDGLVGAWLAHHCGLPPYLSPEKITKHLQSVYRYNLKRDLSTHANPQRPTYALGQEGGLLLCTWPHGGRPTLPFVYSEEVWTGIEYQVASHLISVGLVEEGLDIVRTCRSRYDGRVRNPFDEYECGHWYARAMASYALLYALSGARYDAVEKKLYLKPRIAGDFRSFICTATGYGTVGVKDGRPFIAVRCGTIEVAELVYEPWEAGSANSSASTI